MSPQWYMSSREGKEMAEHKEKNNRLRDQEIDNAQLRRGALLIPVSTQSKLLSAHGNSMRRTKDLSHCQCGQTLGYQPKSSAELIAAAALKSFGL